MNAMSSSSRSPLPANPDAVYIVVPVYNEAAVLGEILGSVIEQGYEVIVVDDGSTDGSFQVAEALPVHRLRHIVNLGQGAALSTGIAYALQEGARFIVTFDADGQHLPRDIAAILAPLLDGRADVALGSRFISPQGDIPPARRTLLKMAVIYTWLATGAWLSDAHNGLRGFTADAARRIQIKQNRMAHASEIISEIVHLKLRYIEVPVQVQYTAYSRRKGQSALNALNILVDMLEGKMK
jgi:glycosyltransferase involved in cell wall biosynthesis